MRPLDLEGVWTKVHAVNGTENMYFICKGEQCGPVFTDCYESDLKFNASGD